MGWVTLDNLDDVFSYHAPDADQRVIYEKLRTEAKQFARAVLELTPPSADQSAAIRLIRDALMTANASVALKGKI